jgi:hypothetical protein
LGRQEKLLEVAGVLLNLDGWRVRIDVNGSFFKFGKRRRWALIGFAGVLVLGGLDLEFGWEKRTRVELVFDGMKVVSVGAIKYVEFDLLNAGNVPMQIGGHESLRFRWVDGSGKRQLQWASQKAKAIFILLPGKRIPQKVECLSGIARFEVGIDSMPISKRGQFQLNPRVPQWIKEAEWIESMFSDKAAKGGGMFWSRAVDAK